MPIRNPYIFPGKRASKSGAPTRENTRFSSICPFSRARFARVSIMIFSHFFAPPRGDRPRSDTLSAFCFCNISMGRARFACPGAAKTWPLVADFLGQGQLRRNLFLVGFSCFRPITRTYDSFNIKCSPARQNSGKMYGYSYKSRDDAKSARAKFRDSIG